jgi:hypothetical protein
MSHITHTILLYRSMEDERARLAEVNRYFRFEPGDKPGFVSAEDTTLPLHWYGGTKMLQCGVALGVHNYLYLAGLVRHLRGRVYWTAPGYVQLCYREEDDERFRLLDIDSPEAAALVVGVILEDDPDDGTP